MKKTRTTLSLIAVLAMLVSCFAGVTAVAEETITSITLDPSLDLASLLEDGTYTIELATQDYLTVECYEIQGVRYCTNIISEDYQYMNIWIPTAYVNEDGTFNYENELNGYTAATAPIIFRNNCSGWNSSDPESDSENCIGLNEYMENGFIYVACGARSRNATETDEDGNFVSSVGKIPAPIVDLKAGIRFLRANADAIPGDVDHIFSIGGSGAGEMSSVIGATGNMDEYYPYLYEIGAIGIEYDEETDTYTSTVDDDVFGCMVYYPIAAVDKAGLAYAWTFVNSDETEVVGKDSTTELTEFLLTLQEDMAYTFVDYINSLGLTDEEGNVLELTGLREGSYYDALLGYMSDGLNAYLAELSEDEATTYMELLMATNTDDLTWIVENEDGTYSVTNIDGYYANYGDEDGDPESFGTRFGRIKSVPGYDAMDVENYDSHAGENSAFGYDDQEAVHFAKIVAELMQENYDEYLEIMTDEEKEQVDLFIEQAISGDLADYVANQAYLMDAVEIMLDVLSGEQEATIASHWRVRVGTADVNAAYNMGFNIALAASANGADSDFALVWGMVHGSEVEGTSAGTFEDWVNDLMAEELAA